MFDRSEIRLWELSINPFISNATFLYPMKTSENLTVFWCFQGVEKGCIGNEWIKDCYFQEP